MLWLLADTESAGCPQTRLCDLGCFRPLLEQHSFLVTGIRGSPSAWHRRPILEADGVWTPPGVVGVVVVAIFYTPPP